MDFDLSTPQEVAAELGISVRAVNMRAQEGRWPSGSVYDLGHGLRRFRLDLILADALERGDAVGRGRAVAPVKQRARRARPGRPQSKAERRQRLMAI